MLSTMPVAVMLQVAGPPLESSVVVKPAPAAPLPSLSPAPEAAVQISPPTLPQTNSSVEIVVTGRRRSASDPLEALNAKSFEATQVVDKAVFGPVALAYKRTMPSPVRSGLHNFFKNLREPVVFANFMLQLKPGKAAETVGRFALNTTIGVVGFVDIAKRKPFNFPRRPNGFAYTLGYYGVKPGPFIFLPFLGPTTLRDAIGGLVDRAVVPGIGGPPFNQPGYAVPATGLGVLDRRAEFEDDLQQIRASGDPYVARREFYLHKRQREIEALHGRSRAAAFFLPSAGPRDAEQFFGRSTHHASDTTASKATVATETAKTAALEP